MLRLDVPRRATINESPQLTRLVMEAEREKGPVELDCAKTETWGPFGLALVVSCFKVRRSSGRETFIVAPKDPEVDLGGLDETALFRWVQRSAGAGDEWQLELVHVSDDGSVEELTRQFTEPLVAATANAPGVVHACLDVLVDNTCRWSESTIGGVVVVRWHKKSHKIKLSLVDRGIGIPASLRRSPTSQLHRATDVEIIESAFSDPGVTSRTDGETGRGLKTLRDTVLTHHGKLTVVSLGAKVSWARDRLTKVSSPAMHGTAVDIELLA
jgi:hypothetical protein